MFTHQWCFLSEFLPFWEKYFQKINSVQNSLIFWKNFMKKNVPKICDNCLQYEMILKILYFHILNITQNWTCIWTIVTWATSQNWEKEHWYTSSGSLICEYTQYLFSHNTR
jgi:hypothetical protein